MENWRDILRREHEAQEGTFVLQLRCGPGWDKEAFNRLFLAMRECCKELDTSENIPRWIANLFWYLDWYVRQTFRDRLDKRNSDPDYYDYYVNAWTNLDHLAFWLFTGIRRDDDEFEPMDVED